MKIADVEIGEKVYLGTLSGVFYKATVKGIGYPPWQADRAQRIRSMVYVEVDEDVDIPIRDMWVDPKNIEPIATTIIEE